MSKPNFLLISKETNRPRWGWIIGGILIFLLLCSGIWLTVDRLRMGKPEVLAVSEATATPDPVLVAILDGNKAQAETNKQFSEAITGLGKKLETLSQPAQPVAPSSEEEATFDLQPLPKEFGRPNVVRVTSGSGMMLAQADTIPTSNPPLDALQVSMAGGNFWVSGGVETATNIEQAKGEFKNTLGLGTQSWLAEPGKLLVNGFDFDLNALKSSEGAIDTWNPTNQQIFGWSAPAFWNLNEGGFALGVANRMTVQVPDRMTFHVQGDDTTAWIVIIRGLYSDFNTPSDRNLNLVVTDYVPGNIMFARYSGTPNGGFIGEGQFRQIADTTQDTWNNCGQSGCPHLFAFFYDANTGAWLVLHRPNPDAPWERMTSNMDYLQ